MKSANWALRRVSVAAALVAVALLARGLLLHAQVVIDAAYVDARLAGIAQSEDLARYVL